MLISKQTRIAVYSYLFKEGTIVVKKDKYQPKHSDELPINNLEVMCLLRSFSSRSLVNETFNWGYYYYYLTNEGIDYLRQYLALPDEIVPATMKKVTNVAPAVAGKSLHRRRQNLIFLWYCTVSLLTSQFPHCRLNPQLLHGQPFSRSIWVGMHKKRKSRNLLKFKECQPMVSMLCEVSQRDDPMASECKDCGLNFGRKIAVSN